MRIVRLVARARAMELRVYCISSIAWRTRALVDSLMLGCPLSTRETVMCETLAARATS
jgi:hypothetical protein